MRYSKKFYFLRFDFSKIIKKEKNWKKKLEKITRALAKMGTDDEITENGLTSAWIALNTRTVYLSHTSDGTNVTNVSRESDDTFNWALIPFLDCLNHHSKAKIETKHSDTHFQITSSSGNNAISKYIQACSCENDLFCRPAWYISKSRFEKVLDWHILENCRERG